MDYPSSETCGTKGSALCGALPSTPLVELVGEYISWDAVTFMGVDRSPFSVLFWPLNVTVLLASLLLVLTWRFLQSTQPPGGGGGLGPFHLQAVLRGF